MTYLVVHVWPIQFGGPPVAFSALTCELLYWNKEAPFLAIELLYSSAPQLSYYVLYTGGLPTKLDPLNKVKVVPAKFG